MTRTTLWIGAGLVTTGMLVTGTVIAQEPVGRRVEITVTNLTRGQRFTPILVVTHREGLRLFALGSPAIPELATLAEEGDVGPLASLLRRMSAVRDIDQGTGLLPPGRSIAFNVLADGEFDHFSMAAMLIPTNDGFFSVNNVAVPKGPETLTLFANAYDSGSERNDELCVSIPGPDFAECGGAGGGRRVGGGEGFVHIHAGVHGIGNLSASERDWRNPVAQITMRRIR